MSGCPPAEIRYHSDAPKDGLSSGCRHTRSRVEPCFSQQDQDFVVGDGLFGRRVIMCCGSPAAAMAGSLTCQTFLRLGS